tara:strand:+ start:1286 stop:1993 length:708 start_codon:yes stop_codon:yes gene_type:complete
MIKISRYAVEKFLNCKRCFFLEQKYKVRLQNLPFTLNNAVDNLCKNEFDHYRKKQQPHPIFVENNIDAVPFNHPNMDDWRNNRKGINYNDLTNGFHFYGAVDDVWIKPNGELIISDVKATAKREFNWFETYKYDYAKGYKRQLEMYQWLFRKNGFNVSNEGFLVYFNGLRNEPMFNKKLNFELHLIKLDCSDEWVEETIIKAIKLLKTNGLPTASKTCSTCSYLKDRWKVKQQID